MDNDNRRGSGLWTEEAKTRFHQPSSQQYPAYEDYSEPATYHPKGTSTSSALRRGRGSVPQRSPLQKLEMEFASKESELRRSLDQGRLRDAYLGRTSSGKYRHRARDAGFAGAAAAMAGGALYEGSSAAERGRLAHQRRKSPMLSPPAQASPISTPEAYSNRNGYYARNDGEIMSSPEGHHVKQSLQSGKMGTGGKKNIKAAQTYQDQDPIPPSKVATAPEDPVNYKIPPQTAAGIEARQQIGFGAEPSPAHQQQQENHHRFRGLFHHHQQHRSYQASGKPLDEWRKAGIARLTLQDIESDARPTIAGAEGAGKDAAWWEVHHHRTSSSGSRAAAPSLAQQMDGPYEEEAKAFRPPLYLKCGPLLRYTGLRREAASASRSGRQRTGEQEVWRGSIMIVTDDRQSDYSSTPVLRLFAQPMDLQSPPPQHLLDSGHQLPVEYEDPIAGQMKLSRTGRPLYVRPVHDLEGEIDLSREENPQGLYAAVRTPVLGPQNVSGPDGRQSQHITFQDKSRVRKNATEKAGRYREVKAVRLHVERGYTFWRFRMEVELGSTQHRIAYRINRGPAIGFWVPARGETMNIMFHSCNGFSLSVNPDEFSGPDPLWRDVLNKHQVRPFHVMLGGGDQVYNDAAMRHTHLFREWLQTKNPESKHRADFTPEMQDELETFYLERYAMWFSQGLFGMANSQIPMVNIWDDHDIIDGFGSYPHHFMSSRVFTGVGAVAFKYYMLFQHQSLVAETSREEPSWLLGASPGPYINELSRSVFVHLGRKVAFLGLDCRTERMRDEILSQESYDAVFDRLRAEIHPGETKHLIVLLGVPIAYPRLNFLENILTSRVMDPIKAIGRAGMLGGFVNKFDGGVEILDDLDDHWTAKHHKAERNWFIQELQELAAEKSVRVTILGGDVHLGAVGQFYTPKTFSVSKDRDHRYMPNVISSAIVNTPPPPMMADVLNRRDKVHHLDEETDEDMIPMFDTDVDGSRRNNRKLLPRRNYCTIREYLPGSTPPPSPRPQQRVFSPESVDGGGEYTPDGREGREQRRYPPGSMKRTMSLTRGPMGLVRRLSGSGRSKNPPPWLGSEHGRPYISHGPGGTQRSNSLSAPPGSYFPEGEQAPQRPINQFHRRPTNLSIKEARKAAAKGGADGADDEREAGHIDLQGGLDISLRMEIDQKDPGGSTIPYRLLVPALWYEGKPDINTAQFGKSRGGGFLDRFKTKGKREIGEDGYSRSPSPSPPPIRGSGRDAPQHTRNPYEEPIMAGAATGRNAYGVDGAQPTANTGRRIVSKQPPLNQDAYNKGYDLGPPPLGAAQPARSGVLNNPYPPQAGYRRSSSQMQQPVRQAANEPWRHDGPYDDEDSLTPSEEYDNEPHAAGNSRQARPHSKAERFFGIGDDQGPWGASGRRPDMQHDDGFDEVVGGKKRTPAWKIWK